MRKGHTMEKIKQTLEAANVKLSWRERFSYGAADVYGTLFGNFLSTFILYYYTDILGISAAVAANILSMPLPQYQPARLQIR